MSLIQDDAVVLARVDYSETSQVIVFFTRRNGKVRAMARGIKRGTKNRFAVGIDLFESGTVVFSARQERSEALATMTEWKQLRAFSGLRDSLDRLHAAQYAAEITANLTEDRDPNADLFHALTDALDAISSGAAPVPQVVRFQRRLLTAIGLWPRFDVCVICARTAELTHFSSLEGGVICRHCEPGQIEKWQVGAATRTLLARPPADHAEHATPMTDSVPRAAGTPKASLWLAAFSVLNYHVAHLMGRDPVLAAKLVPTRQRRTLDERS